MWYLPLIVILTGISLAHIPLFFVYVYYLKKDRVDLQTLADFPSEVIDDLLLLYMIYKPREIKRMRIFR